MLHLYYDKKKIEKHLVTNIDRAFDKREDMWFYSNFTVDIAKKIDCVELLPPKKIISPLFGEADVTFLSKYVKLFILLKENPNAVYRLSDVHPDLGGVLCELSKSNNIHILADSSYDFTEEQEATLPEFSISLKGSIELKSTYNNYVRGKLKRGDKVNA